MLFYSKTSLKGRATESLCNLTILCKLDNLFALSIFHNYKMDYLKLNHQLNLPSSRGSTSSGQNPFVRKTFWQRTQYSKDYSTNWLLTKYQCNSFIGEMSLYTITVIHRLLIYTSMKHSLLLLKTFSACAPLFRHPVWH